MLDRSSFNVFSQAQSKVTYICFKGQAACIFTNTFLFLSSLSYLSFVVFWGCAIILTSFACDWVDLDKNADKSICLVVGGDQMRLGWVPKQEYEYEKFSFYQSTINAWCTISSKNARSAKCFRTWIDKSKFGHIYKGFQINWGQNELTSSYKLSRGKEEELKGPPSLPIS